MKVALGQISVIPGNPRENFKKIKKQVSLAKKKRVDIIIFPEMSIPGYLLSDLWEDEAFVDDCVSYNQKIIKISKGITIVFGNVLVDKKLRGNDGRLRKYNGAIVVSNGKLIGTTIKTNEPLYREFEDQRHFLPLKELAQQIDKPLEQLLQPICIRIGKQKIKLGVVICEDIWITDYIYKNKLLNPSLMLAKNGADIIIAISMSPYGWHKEIARKKNVAIVQNELKSVGYNLPLVYLNGLGVQNNGKNEYVFDGKSAVYDPAGTLRFEAPSLKEGLFFVDTDNYPKKPNLSLPTKVSERQELLDTLIYATKNFCLQKNVKKVVIGLSGGIDSAFVAYLYTKAIGKKHVLAVNMPSKFNSNWTKNTARTVAKNLGIKYQVIPIENVANCVRKSTGVFGGIQDENLQARVRSADILAGIAAKNHAIYTCNGNKSELLFGWFTLDGDGRGAICPIADLYKTQVIDLCAHINEQKFTFPWELISPVFDEERYFDNWDGKRTIIPKNTKSLVPSAELSDKQNVDKGLGDPIIFGYHDALLRQFVEYRKNPEDVLRAFLDGNLDKFLWLSNRQFDKYIKSNFPTTSLWISDLEKTWKLFHRSVYKQIQSPPIISVSKRPLGFDFRRSQLDPYFTDRYFSLKKLALDKIL